MTDAEQQELLDEIERLRAALKRIASGWPKPKQLARETLENKKWIILHVGLASKRLHV